MYLVRPDGYVALAATHAAGAKLASYFRKHGLESNGKDFKQP